MSSRDLVGQVQGHRCPGGATRLRSQAGSPGVLKPTLALLTVIFGMSRILFADPPLRYSSGAENSPWGVVSSEEWSGEYPRYNVPLRQIGVTWLRYFPDWEQLQQAHGKWDWRESDPLVVNCRRNSIQLSGVFAYLAKFASSADDTRTFPITDMQYWRDYVAGTVLRYRDEMNTWEVWNEFNGDAEFGDRPEVYAELLAEAYRSAKEVEPKTKIGLNCSGFDLQFIDSVLGRGGAGKLDFVAISPFMQLESVIADYNESGYLSMAGELRKILRNNGMDEKTELWISAIGFQAPNQEDSAADNIQAEALLKAYILALAQGFKRVFWYEARGPSHHNDGFDYGLIRHDWMTRPSFRALESMIAILGKEPIYIGWVEPAPGFCGFVFHGKNGKVLVAWSLLPSAAGTLAFHSQVSFVNHKGEESALAPASPLGLGRMPVFILNPPGDMLEEAAQNISKPFPWALNFSRASEVSCRLGAGNLNLGVEQIKLQNSRIIARKKLSWRQTKPEVADGGRVYFKVDPGFAAAAPKVRVSATVMNPGDSPVKVSLFYESLTGYKQADESFDIPPDKQWRTASWSMEDASFTGGWGWSLRLESSPDTPMAFKELRIQKLR